MSTAAAQALSPSAPSPIRVAVAEIDELCWRPVLGLECLLTVDLPLPNFKVADFLALRVDSVVGTNWRLAHDVPLRVNGTLIAWAEFEGAGGKLAVRLTELV
ncbi:MAG TPA: FliM/FliN family flagellar motor C-terminal domain-containing protein [Candidatus Sulfotelmatobacter sp.]